MTPPSSDSSSATKEAAATASYAAPTIARFRAEYAGTGGIVGTATPRLSWAIGGAESWIQESYSLRSGDETVEVDSDESLFVPWPFAPLASRERRAVRVRASSSDGRQTEWSDELWVEAALLDASDWQAVFVGPAEPGSGPQHPCPFVRYEFDVDRPVASARLYVTALGLYEPYLNGSVVGEEVLAPNWTTYKKRVRYQTFDVTDRLRQGRNALGAILGDGWYRGKIASRTYGDALALLAQLEITFTDGSTHIVASDESCRTRTGPIFESDIYDGERYDARLELSGWSEPGYDDSDWRPVVIVEQPLETLVAAPDPPIRRIEELPVLEVLESPSGKIILDFGQNLVGWLRITVSGNAGDTITLQHAECLQNGELGRENIVGGIGAAAEDVYVLNGSGLETWEPRFTFHGFRYASLEGWPGSFDPASVRAIVVHTDFERIGWFECSNPLVNKLHENAVWTLRGNFVGVPTDCPQRSERLGWTGDFQQFCPSATCLYDITGATASWLADLALDQHADGRMPHVIPDVWDNGLWKNIGLEDEGLLEKHWIYGATLTSSAGWGDAAVIVPWLLYERFGDRDLLARQWQSMHRWVDYVEGLAGDNRLWEGNLTFGDWLQPWAPHDHAHQGPTPPEFLCTAYFARSADLVARAAEALGLDEDADHYRKLADEVRSAFSGAFMDDGGNVIAASTTAQALVLAFGLAETDEQRRRAGERLSQIVRATGYRATTGLIGTPIICDALCEAGDLEGAYRLLLQTEFPSWLYPVTIGATTIWERWDTFQEDGRWNGRLSSLNHYAFGSVVDWLHRTVAGIAPAEPGYRKIRFQPRPDGDLTHASARYITPYGAATIAWRIDNGSLDIQIEVPANTTAEVVLPDGSEPVEVQSGSHRWRLEAA